MFKHITNRFSKSLRSFRKIKYGLNQLNRKWIFGGIASIGITTFSMARTILYSHHHPHSDKYPIEDAIFTFAPHVPPPITRNYPVNLRVNMDVQIKTSTIDGINDFEFWTFNGQVPGPFFRARVGDVMEVTLKNDDDSGMLHNIDFHSVTGQGGGSSLLTASFEESKTAFFKLLHPGLFIYHCSVDPIGVHIGNGMYGLMLVEPEDGLSYADREFYILQSELYTEEMPIDDSNTLPFSMQRGLDENPNYVVYNGRVGSLTGENTLKAKVGEKIRIFFGNAGPNLVSSFHIIGALMDKLYREGDLISPPARGIQTALIPSAGAAMIEFDAIVPGIYSLVDHSIWRVDKGCVGFIDVEGEPRPDIYYSEQEPIVCPSCKVHP